MDKQKNFSPSSIVLSNECLKQLHRVLQIAVLNNNNSFHIDFGGSSVFYHVLSGEKHFYFVEPTLVNLKKYERWSDSQDQSNVFFGDLVKECIKVVLYPGNTMIIPSGWVRLVNDAYKS